MKKILTALLAIATIAGFVSCKSDNASYGKTGEVLVVIEKDQWEGELGEALRQVLESYYPCLPQDEMRYSVQHVTAKDFEKSKSRQKHRSIIMFEFEKGLTSASLVPQKNKWSDPQLVLTIKASDPQWAAYFVRQKAGKIIKRLEDFQLETMIEQMRKNDQTGLQSAVHDFVVGGTMCFPTSWYVKKQTEDFLWLACDSSLKGKEIQQGIFIYKYPADAGKEALALDALVQKRNEVLWKNVPGATVNGMRTYMTTTDDPAPMIHYRSSASEIKFAELRGFWHMENDYMGGPFISHTFMKKDTQEFVCIEGFVYAPSHNKLKYVREIDAMLHSFSW